MNKKNRNKAIDMVKGIGMLYIMMSHSGYLFPMSGFFYYMYIPIFFVCSGLTFHEYDSLKKELISLVKRLIVPIIVYRVFSISLGIGFDFFSRTLSCEKILGAIVSAIYSRYSLYPLDETTENHFFTQYMLNEWFLPALFLASVLFVLIKRMGKNKNFKKYYSSVAIVLIAFSIVLSRLPVLLPWSIDTVPTCALFMVSGYILKQTGYMEKEGNLKDILLGAGLGLVVVIISNYNGGINLSVRMYGSRGEASIIIYIVGATACCISCLLVCKFLKHIKVCRLFATIGSSTLIIYMLHSWIFVLIDKIMAETKVWGDIEYALFKVLVALAVSLFIDCLFKKFKKRYRNVLSDK